MTGAQERSAYIEMYGKSAWSRAVSLANGHRRRAHLEYSLTEHWTASQWLDLIGSFDLRCAFCSATDALTPHHRKDLVRGGSNTISNILPLCRRCHIAVHQHHIDCDPNWLTDQQNLCRKLHPGSLVQFKNFGRKTWPSLQSMPVIVVGIVAPHLWEHFPNIATGGLEIMRGGLVLQERQLSFWKPAKATIGYIHSDGVSPGHSFDARDMRKVSEDELATLLNTCLAKQEWLCRRFKEGDLVSWEFGMFRGVITRVRPSACTCLRLQIGAFEISVPTLVPFAAEAEIALLTETGEPIGEVTTANLQELRLTPPH